MKRTQKNITSLSFLKGVLTLTILLFLFGCQNKEKEIGTTDLPVEKRVFSDHRPDEGKKVQVLETAEGYRLFRNGAPYFVKGGAGDKHLGILKHSGGNSVRTYNTAGLDTLLDQAHAFDISVMVGIELEKLQYGFSYEDEVAVKKQKEAVRQIILKYKDHPAVLSWTLGNEVLYGTTKELVPVLKALEDLAVMAHEIDPDHPVNTAVFSMAGQIKLLSDHCPSLDFVMVNGFGVLRNPDSDLRKELEAYKKPYIISEWGVNGWWEMRETPWYAPVESSLRSKVEQMVQVYDGFILANKTYCLGSYVFFWGQKQEVTPTWFSLFLETGEKTVLVDALNQLWEGAPPENQAPLLEEIEVVRKSGEEFPFLETGTEFVAKVQASDPEGDTLKYSWRILREGPILDPERYGVELPLPVIANSVRETAAGEARLQVPEKAGAYRLMVYAYDGKGNGAYANMPFFAVNNSLTTVVSEQSGEKKM